MVVLEKTSLSEILSMYKEVCEEIENYEVLLKEINSQWKINYGLMERNPSPNGGGYIPVTMDIVAGHMDKLRDKHDRIERILKANRKLKKVAEEMLKKFNGTDYKVAYARFVEGKKLEDIAEELNYSIDGIKKISSRITRALTRH
ncbi:hypothetical protein [Niallia sp. 03190]|uniref:hypothetical protein n=1 Tax=Niallia sp. 03190 TaxID=3458061 RepID=UPI00404405DB